MLLVDRLLHHLKSRKIADEAANAKMIVDLINTTERDETIWEKDGGVFQRFRTTNLDCPLVLEKQDLGWSLLADDLQFRTLLFRSRLLEGLGVVIKAIRKTGPR